MRVLVVGIGRLGDAASATLTADDPGRRGAPARDYTLGDERWETHARLIGAEAVTASSSQADADGAGATVPEHQPYSAFDGLTSTQWQSVVGDEDPWVSVELARPVTLRTVVVVGHNPTMALLATLLDDGEGDEEASNSVTLGFPTSALAVFSYDGDWADLDEASARVVAYHVGRG